MQGSSVRGILQARILEWVAISFYRRSSELQGLNPGFPHCRQIVYYLGHQVSPKVLEIFIKSPNLLEQILVLLEGENPAHH